VVLLEEALEQSFDVSVEFGLTIEHKLGSGWRFIVLANSGEVRQFTGGGLLV
jgi:hypothetical protein